MEDQMNIIGEWTKLVQKLQIIFFSLRSMTLLTPDTLTDKNSSKSEKQTHIFLGPWQHNSSPSRCSQHPMSLVTNTGLYNYPETSLLIARHVTMIQFVTRHKPLDTIWREGCSQSSEGSKRPGDWESSYRQCRLMTIVIFFPGKHYFLLANGEFNKNC